MRCKKIVFFVTKITVCIFLTFFVAAVFAGGGKSSGKMSDYIRVSKQEGKVQMVSLDTPIVKFENKKEGIEVALIGAVHIADQKYYEELNDEFKKYDAVLFELVVEEDSKGKDNKLKKQLFDKKKSQKGLQKSMGEMLDLAYQIDHVDYRAGNMVHADLTLEEFVKRVSERGDLLLWFISEYLNAIAGMSNGDGLEELELEGRLVGSIFSSNPALSLKRNIARIFTSKLADSSSQSFFKEGSVIISDRNEAALKVLKKEIKKGNKKIAIFYGCGHLPEFATSLKKDFKLQKTKTTWLIAWDLTKNKTARK
ncbi:MAG: hypothetical protein LBL39_02630 [Planctomycetaceae bacterium]|jgi:hypothetical protein|nr:hypothetical protein [Planctomycetaceae bacterium]